MGFYDRFFARVVRDRKAARNAKDYILSDDVDEDEGGLSDFLDEDTNMDNFYGSDEDDNKGTQQQQQQKLFSSSISPFGSQSFVCIQPTQ